MKHHPPPISVVRARQLRHEPTDAEQRMWRLLREHFPEARFRRQVPIRHFIADFASHRAKVVIEIDGGQHNAQADAARTAAIEAEGYRVERFWNNDVLSNGEGCAIRLGQVLAQPHPHPAATRRQAAKSPHPSPIKGEEGADSSPLMGEGYRSLTAQRASEGWMGVTSQPGTEPAFIAALRALATHPAARGLEDDAAVLEIGAETLVLTHDMLVEGVHFLPGADPADIAWKLVATNVSDLAAKGAQPIGVLLGYTLGEGDARFVTGLGAALAHYGAALLGGDTVANPQGARTYGLTAIGRATHTPVPSRSGVQSGDGVWLCGALGGAMVGLEALRSGEGDSLAYRRPVALLAEGIALAPHVTAMMDVSDGLLLDASRMAVASGVCLSLESAAPPLACPEARRAEALRWGDDYALLFTLSAGVHSPVAATRIGEVLPGPARLLLDGAEPEGTLGYSHSACG